MKSDLIDSLNIKPRLEQLYEIKLQNIFYEIANELSLEFGVTITPEDVELCIKPVGDLMSDVDLLNNMIAEIKEKLFGEDKVKIPDLRLEYMNMVMSLLRTKQKLIGIDKDDSKDNDNDSLRLQQSLEKAGIVFTPSVVKSKFNDISTVVESNGE